MSTVMPAIPCSASDVICLESRSGHDTYPTRRIFTDNLTTPTEAVVLTFPSALAKDATASLCATRFRFNKVLQYWESLTRSDDAEALAKTHGGSARRIAASAPHSPAPAPETAAE